MHLLGECSEFIRFSAKLAQFCPSSGLKMTENGGFQPLSDKVFMQSNSNMVCTLIWWVFRIDSLWDHIGQKFGPLVATKWLKMGVSNHYLKKYSRNPIQTWFVHLFGECSELMRYWATLAKFLAATKQL